ncbi:DUF6541 family protein [Schumannella sp. 10F1B-5-1]|uniref:DUF6541 family protein n=1 Tax=Schumannella sp. 10F1B-5-1 TaxID=2590780 RepID=UPI001131E269|nr:DUF6541 family protein [Schumannella sp. 10F1B-5-1]TPW70690.1 DUF4175 domain-containing protein [Schumannella sp. 10F1B-5-1]
MTIVAPVLAALLVIFLPGALIGVAACIRPVHVLGLAPVLSVSAITLAALADQLVPLPWTPANPLLAAIVIAAVTWTGRRVWERRWPRTAVASRSIRLLTAGIVGAVVAGVLIGGRLLVAFGAPDNISQTFDNVYHLNAVEWILQTGIASPFQQLIPGFYPDAWHALTATVASLSGSDVPTAVNAVALVIAAIVWPLSNMVLVRALTSSVWGVLFAAVASAGLAAFPLALLDFGVLYPNALSLSLVPAVFALAIRAAGLSRDQSLERASAWWIFLVALPGLALAHPSAVMALIAMSTAPGLTWFARVIRSQRRSGVSSFRRVATVIVWAGVLAGAAVLLIKARPTYEQAFWGPIMSVPQALWEGVTNSAMSKPVPFAVTIAMLLGVMAAFALRRGRWLVVSWGVMVTLWVVCASLPRGSLRYWLTGTWYSDNQRLAALLPLVAVPLAAWGASWLVGVVATRVRMTHSIRRLIPVAGLLILVVASQATPPLQVATASAQSTYRLSSASVLVSSDERELLERLDKTVPKGDVIVGSPWTGAALSFAIGGRSALIPHIYWGWTKDDETILLRLDEADTDPSVCRALSRTKTRWVLDFGKKEVHGDRHDYPGLDDLSRSDVVTLADSVGDARLYRITACN